MNIIISGVLGRMGRAVEAAVNAAGHTVICGIDVCVEQAGKPLGVTYPVYPSINDFDGKADALIDFSHHTAIFSIMDYAVKNNLPCVISTTGHTEEEIAYMKAASEKVPVFYSRNMSLGINLLIELAKIATKTLGIDYNIEIIEKHHNQKLDAPSGTALMIADALKETVEFDAEYIYDRSQRREKRAANEIGLHAIRGGTIVGEHDVIFAGKDEVITLSHSAQSRELFATSSVKAAAFIIGKAPRIYDMGDMVKANI